VAAGWRRARRRGDTGARRTKRKDGLVATSYTPEGLGQNGADGLHGLKDGPCDILF
jgi:hypothetical protein